MAIFCAWSVDGGADPLLFLGKAGAEILAKIPPTIIWEDEYVDTFSLKLYHIQNNQGNHVGEALRQGAPGPPWTTTTPGGGLQGPKSHV